MTQTEVCFQPWYNLSWLTRLKAPNNKQINPMTVKDVRMPARHTDFSIFWPKHRKSLGLEHLFIQRDKTRNFWTKQPITLQSIQPFLVSPNYRSKEQEKNWNLSVNNKNKNPAKYCLYWSSSSITLTAFIFISTSSVFKHPPCCWTALKKDMIESSVRTSGRNCLRGKKTLFFFFWTQTLSVYQYMFTKEFKNYDTSLIFFYEFLFAGAPEINGSSAENPELSKVLWKPWAWSML